MSDTLLVTGASGHLGRLVIDQLLNVQKVPASQIIVTTRKPETVVDLAALGVQVRAADFDDLTSLSTAFAGATRLLLISTDAVDRPGRRLTQHLNAVKAAVSAGVKHVLYTSMVKPDAGSPILFAPDHLGTEQALAASGLGYTILRHSWYQENLLMSLPQTLASGQWYTSAGDGRQAHVARADCAAVDAALLAHGPAGNLTYNVTGAQAYTTAEIAQIATEVLGKPIQVIPLTDEQLTQGLTAAGVPAPIVPFIVCFDANTRLGNVDVVTDAVQSLAGRAPRTLRQFFIDNKAVLAA
jgi:NAD(P)H dehydrogenase (quinone)